VIVSDGGELVMPVQVTTTFETLVDDMAEAWVFVMGRVDLVGDSPEVLVRPVSCFVATVGDDGVDVDGGLVRKFEVSVSGMVEE
jgi:hypothetical protein